MGCLNFFRKIMDTILGIILGILLSISQINTDSHRPPEYYFTPTATITEPTTMTSPTPTATPEAASTPTKTNQSGFLEEGDLTPIPSFSRPEPGSICPYHPTIDALHDAFEQDAWVNWIKWLSGEDPIELNNESVLILTRYSESLFNGHPDARAYEFVLSQLQTWGFELGTTLFEHTYQPGLGEDAPNWKNLIVVLPGTDPDLANEEVLMTAHLDSTAIGTPETKAPGADDNGSGVATLLEAVRLLKDVPFKRTIKIIFFTGEEQGLYGSKAYMTQYSSDLKNIIGVINLDMFGYDADQDRCFEMHVGEMEASNLIGGCLGDTIEIYDPELQFEYLTSEALGYSDHASFWDADVGAIEVLENFHTHTNGICGTADVNPNYHSEGDVIWAMNLETAHRIAASAIAALARLAEPAGD
jgi:hypothetical protein